MTIFLINNSGYAYERLIHKPDEDYHNIAPWDYLSLPMAFGGAEALKHARDLGEEYVIETARLDTWADVEDLLVDERFDNGFGGTGKKGLRFVDIRVGKTDVPEKFRRIFESAGEKLG